MFEGFAPGKLILSGEHAVVYGHPAIAVAIDRGTRVRLEPGSGPTTCLPAPDERLREALRIALPSHGLRVGLSSELPIGRGMGSSAALAVALVRARAAWQGHPLTIDECLDGALQIERVFHGRPSGVDHTVVTLGGALRFQRDQQGPQLEPLQVPAGLRLVVLDSGVPGDTAALVAQVRARPADGTLARIGALTEQAQGALATGDLEGLGALLTENHRLLARLGVSTPALDALVSLALDAGALGAKLAGAGGGGVILALVRDPQPLLDSAGRHGVPAMSVGIHPTGG